MDAATNEQVIGIVGGGQLARMMLQEAPQAGLAPRVITGSRVDPAAKVSRACAFGPLDEHETLRAFFAACDVVTFESEFHPADRLQAAAAGLEVTFCPSLAALAVMQDKLRQKALLERLGVASAPHRALVADDAWESWLESCYRDLGPRLVLKWARLGYDGKGTLFVERGGDLGAIPAFLAAARSKGTPVFAEQRVDFVRELAIVAVHGREGSFAEYPLVVSEQEAGICKRVFGPAMDFGVDPALHLRACAYARAVAQALPLHGAFALELFETRDGGLLVNEMAPRVHNSGHYTLDAAETSQFENHLRAVAALPLGSTRTQRPFAMLNLIANRRAAAPPAPSVSAPTVAHWYEKAEARPGRKMGHLNATAPSAGALSQIMRALADDDARWLAALAARDEEER